MKSILNFLIEAGELKGKERRGWILHQIKNPETTAEHIFFLALLVWVLGKRKKINLNKAIKMALIHDLCEVHTEDLTPYDPLLPKNKKGIVETLKKWPKFTLALKRKKEREKDKKESLALYRITSKLPRELKAEMRRLWLDFSKGLSKEGRFVRQADKMANLLQGMEYWKKYGKIQHRLWMRWIKEITDDPTLIKFIKIIERNFINE